jgi:hypothetical protein
MSWSGALVDFKDGVSWTGAANSDTTPNFYLLGGKYALTTVSNGTASATIQQKQPDGTFIAVSSAIANGVLLDLPPATYNIAMGASAGTAAGALVRVPYRGP